MILILMEYTYFIIQQMEGPDRQNSNDEYQVQLTPLKMGDLELHPYSCEVFRKGKKIPLRKKEYQLLEFFMQNKDRVINRHTLLEYIWDYDAQAMTNTLDVHIASLRRKIDQKHTLKMLHTVYGSGYMLSDH